MHHIGRIGFGGSGLIECTVPLAFQGRFFIFKAGDPPVVTVVKCIGRQLVFEVKDNGPVGNMLTSVTRAPGGAVTVSEKSTGRFLYRLLPGRETCVVFGRADGGETAALVSDRQIRIGRVAAENRPFLGGRCGVTVGPNGSVGEGSTVPLSLVQWLRE